MMIKLLAIMALLIAVLPAAAADKAGDAAALKKQEKALHKKIAALKQERDFLVFQKAMYAADSRYVVLDIAKGNGQLKYKNRVLKDFSFAPTAAGKARIPERGAVDLTAKKADKENKGIVLTFGKTFIFTEEGTSQSETEVPVIALDEKDLVSLYFALEPGSPAYLLR